MPTALFIDFYAWLIATAELYSDQIGVYAFLPNTSLQIGKLKKYNG